MKRIKKVSLLLDRDAPCAGYNNLRIAIMPEDGDSSVLTQVVDLSCAINSDNPERDMLAIVLDDMKEKLLNHLFPNSEEAN